MRPEETVTVEGELVVLRHSVTEGNKVYLGGLRLLRVGQPKSQETEHFSEQVRCHLVTYGSVYATS